jgi:hypothetical protein
MPAEPARFWPAVLASSVVATLLSPVINFGIDVLHHKPYERARERAQRSREVANVALDKAVILHKRLGALFLQFTIPATASDEHVRVQATTLLVLADTLNDDCLKQPFISVPCRHYIDWTKEAVPLFEKLSSHTGRPLMTLRNLPEPKSAALVQDLTTVVNGLRQIVETSFE